MAKLTVGKGLDEFVEKLEDLEFDESGMTGKAVYEGARVVADRVRANINALPVIKNTKNRKRGVTQAEKDGLLAGLGIANLSVDSGLINVKISMDGYNSDVTDNYPNGHPNLMIARALEKGTSFAPPTKFISTAGRAAKSEAEEAMRKVLEEEIKKIDK